MSSLKSEIIKKSEPEFRRLAASLVKSIVERIRIDEGNRSGAEQLAFDLLVTTATNGALGALDVMGAATPAEETEQ